jgi:mono/diheme cytochrome c family protein
MGQGAGAMATEPGDVVAGEALARTWCGDCHVTERRPGGAANDAAPSFPGVARRPQTTSMSLRVFLGTPHANMPNYQLSQTELDDVVAYILSLRAAR